MKIVNRISILIAVVFTVFILFVIEYRYLQNRAYQLYVQSKLLSDQKIIANVMDFKTMGLLRSTIDNSAWDEMLEFTKSRDMQWAEDNLKVSRVTFGLSFIGVYDLQKNPLVTFHDSISGTFNIPADIIKKWFEKDKTIHWYYSFEGRIFDIFGAVIVPSTDIDFKTKENGYLIFAKQLDPGYLAELEETTGFGAELITDKDNASLTGIKIVQPLPNGLGADIAYLAFTIRQPLQVKLTDLRYLGIIALGLFALGLIMVFFLINKWLTVPLRKITRSLETGQEEPISDLLKKRNEFGKIALLVSDFGTQKKHLEAEIRTRTEATEKYLALLKAIPDNMFILDKQGIFLDYYATQESLLYADPNQFLGRSLREIFPPELADLFMESIQAVVEGKILKPVEYSLDLQGKQSYFELRAIFLDQNRILSIVRDITETRRAQDDLIQAKERAEESDRLKSAFLSNMSHEIRTPMNGIIGFSELLEDESLSAEDRKKFISIISKSGKQLMTVIDDIIDISRIEYNQITLSPSAFNLNHFLDSMLIRFEQEKNKVGRTGIRLELVKSLENDRCNIFTDDIRLEQVLNNLIGNALKFTATGFVRFGYHYDKEWLCFFVQNTGKGIAPDKQKFIFERFRQEEDTDVRFFGGAGLGLAIAKGLVELLGGEISVESTVGEGSLFTFTLPASVLTDEVQPETPADETVPVYDFRGRTILVVEDIYDNFELIELILQQAGPTLINAPDGLNAIRICRSREDIDLVLMDIRMPVMDGFTATSEIRKFRPNLPILALTAHALKEDAAHCMEVGCDEYITKPIQKEKLLSLIHKHLMKKGR